MCVCVCVCSSGRKEVTSECPEKRQACCVFCVSSLCSKTQRESMGFTGDWTAEIRSRFVSHPTSTLKDSYSRCLSRRETAENGFNVLGRWNGCHPSLSFYSWRTKVAVFLTTTTLSPHWCSRSPSWRAGARRCLRQAWRTVVWRKSA